MPDVTATRARFARKAEKARLCEGCRDPLHPDLDGEGHLCLGCEGLVCFGCGTHYYDPNPELGFCRACISEAS